ncbi:WecB/TagA/CpsF family glycosyltransferase [Stieleria sp. JC731]|uniref:WecB/TagA/CpsF family glycosyltransferase n=1 Tax=Pirellulaceae TaxID=2691357 RepID=UPI001E5E0EC7|nr:WecB/TagA/CpsF family glycosyltransferase [Stieleria sp. JC731]MCC9600118.1 WecB/TagA/CpsF family glycosyltransferase [Stieleria sp. JC731]
MSIQPTGSFTSVPSVAPVVLPPQPTPQVPDPLPALERVSVWDVPFDCVDMDQAVERIEALIRRGEPSYVITANLNYVMLHAQQPDMPAITEQADLILADGQPIVWRSKLGPQELPERVAGSEMIYKLAQAASQNRWGIYFLGGEAGVAEACAKRLARDYPGMRIAGIESPPFRQLTEQEQLAQDQRIRESDAQILLVAFGQPKGERWIHENYKRLGVPVSIQLGASFDFIAGTAKRAPKVWQKLGAEWAYRMFSDPKRLVPRYASNAAFLLGALIKDWRRKVESWGMGVQTPQQEDSSR